MLSGSLRSLLVDEVAVIHRRARVRIYFKEYGLGDELVGRRNGIAAGIGNVSRSIPVELEVAELVKADIRSSVLLGIKPGFDSGNGLHEGEVQAERFRRTLNLLNGRSDRNILQRFQNNVCRFSVWRNFGIDVVGKIREILLWRCSISGMIAACRRRRRVLEPGKFLLEPCRCI